MTRVIAAAIVAGSLLAPTAVHAFDLQGHRGARGLAPENTLAGFEAALSGAASPPAGPASPEGETPSQSEEPSGQ